MEKELKACRKNCDQKDEEATLLRGQLRELEEVQESNQQMVHQVREERERADVLARQFQERQEVHKYVDG